MGDTRTCFSHDGNMPVGWNNGRWANWARSQVGWQGSGSRAILRTDFDREKNSICYNKKEHWKDVFWGYLWGGGDNTRRAFCLMDFIFSLWNMRLRVRKKEVEPEVWWESSHCKDWTHNLIIETKRLLERLLLIVSAGKMNFRIWK